MGFAGFAAGNVGHGLADAISQKLKKIATSLMLFGRIITASVSRAACLPMLLFFFQLTTYN
jgi:hypothetical protein